MRKFEKTEVFYKYVTRGVIRISVFLILTFLIYYVSFFIIAHIIHLKIIEEKDARGLNILTIAYPLITFGILYVITFVGFIWYFLNPYPLIPYLVIKIFKRTNEANKFLKTGVITSELLQILINITVGFLVLLIFRELLITLPYFIKVTYWALPHS